METPNDTNATEEVVSAVNPFGGDTDWGDEPLSISDRGDNIEPVAEETSTDDSETTTVEDSEVDDVSDSVDDSDTAIDTIPDTDDDVVDDESDDTDNEAELKDSDPRDDRIPRTRLNKEIEKRRALEERVRELESAPAPAEQPVAQDSPTAPAPKVTADDFDQLSEALLSDESEKAMELFEKMVNGTVANQIEQVRTEAKAEAKNAIEADRQTTALKQTAAELGAKYPELDHKSDLADETLIEEVVETRNLYIERGVSPAEALEKSVRLVALDYDLKDRTAKKPEAKPEVKTKRDVKKKIALSEKEKGRLEGDSGSNRDTRPNLLKMSDDDFATVSQEALREARGDFT